MNVCERGGRVSAMRSVWMAESDAGARQRRSLFVCVLLFEFAEDDAVGVGGRERVGGNLLVDNAAVITLDA